MACHAALNAYTPGLARWAPCVPAEQQTDGGTLTRRAVPFYGGAFRRWWCVSLLPVAFQRFASANWLLRRPFF